MNGGAGGRLVSNAASAESLTVWLEVIALIANGSEEHLAFAVVERRR